MSLLLDYILKSPNDLSNVVFVCLISKNQFLLVTGLGWNIITVIVIAIIIISKNQFFLVTGLGWNITTVLVIAIIIIGCSSGGSSVVLAVKESKPRPDVTPW